MLFYGISAYIKNYREDLLALNQPGKEIVRFSEAGNTYIQCELCWNDSRTEGKVIFPNPLKREEVAGYVIVVSFIPQSETVLVINSEQMEEEPFYQGWLKRFSVSWQARIVRFFKGGKIVEVRDLSVHILEDSIILRKQKVFEGPLPFEQGEWAVQEVLPEMLKSLTAKIVEAYESEVIRSKTYNRSLEEDRQLCLKFNV
jgi:hypothetical protein